MAEATKPFVPDPGVWYDSTPGGPGCEMPEFVKTNMRHQGLDPEDIIDEVPEDEIMIRPADGHSDCPRGCGWVGLDKDVEAHKNQAHGKLVGAMRTREANEKRSIGRKRWWKEVLEGKRKPPKRCGRLLAKWRETHPTGR